MTEVFFVIALIALATLTELRWGETRHGPSVVTALLVTSFGFALWLLLTRL